MKKINYVREKDFSVIEQEFEDFHYEITEKLQKIFKDEKLKPTQIISSEDGKTLKFAINNAEEREKRELGEEIYVIKIEKLNYTK